MFLRSSNRCENKTLCKEKLSLVLPETPPYFPRQFDRCAVIGNSGDLLKTRFGKEIDDYDVVIRENGAPIQVKFYIGCANFISTLLCLLLTICVYQNYTDYVGKKSSFRLLNRGSAKALDKVVELDGMCGTLLIMFSDSTEDIVTILFCRNEEGSSDHKNNNP